MKPSFKFSLFLAASSLIAVTSALRAQTINVDLTTNNSGSITLASGDNTVSFTSFGIDYLIVGGGGGGGAGISTAGGGGGGGAGGLLEGQNLLIGGAQTITVGKGGAGGTGGNTTGSTNIGQAGVDSSAFGFIAKGGGYGGKFDVSGGAGGSGGGAAARGSTNNTIGASGGAAESGQGNNGGSRNGSTSSGASSGGGAGGAGLNGSGTAGRIGGAALTRNITGAEISYAGGGGGGGSTAGGSSTTGGNGGFGTTAGSNAAAHTGGGGGGGGNSAGGNSGGAGGSGIVVVRYSGPQVLTGGTVTTVGSDTVHTFLYNGSGNSTSYSLDLHSATIAGEINGGGNLLWNKTGTLTLSGGNSYTGTTTISSGTLEVQSTIASSSGITNNSALVFNSGSAQNYGNGIGGTGSLTKQGAGKLTLTGTNDYGGATTVTGGSLAVNGSLTATSSVTVATGATLQGSGTINSSVTIQSAGTLAAGNSIESLGTGTLTLDAESTFAYEIDKSAAAGVAGDLTYVTGDLNLAGTNDVILSLTDLGLTGTWDLADKLTLISYTGAWNGGLFEYNSAVLNDGDSFVFSGVTWQFDYNDTIEGSNYTENSTGNYVTMTVTAIPEPATALLGSLGLLFLLRRRR